MSSLLAVSALLALQTPSIVPSQTTVAIVPAYNATDEKDPVHKLAECEMASSRLAALFESRSFTVVPAEKVLPVVAKFSIDFSDHEQRTKANLKRIAKEANARLVTLVVITDSTQRTSSGFTGGTVGRVGLTFWLYDAQTEKGILDAVTVVGESKGGLAGVATKGQSRRVAAVRIALDNLLTKKKDAFLAGYPIKEGVKL